MSEQKVADIVYIVLTEEAYAKGRKVFRKEEDAIAYARALEQATNLGVDIIIERCNLDTGACSYVNY